MGRAAPLALRGSRFGLYLTSRTATGATAAATATARTLLAATARLLATAAFALLRTTTTSLRALTARSTLTLSTAPTALGRLAPLATLALRPTTAAVGAVAAPRRTLRRTASAAALATCTSAFLATTPALATLLLATRFRAASATATEALTHLLHALLQTLTHLRADLASTCCRRRALAALTLPFVVALPAAAASLLRVQRDSEEEDREGHQNCRCFHKGLPIVRGAPTTARKAVRPHQLPP